MFWFGMEHSRSIFIISLFILTIYFATALGPKCSSPRLVRCGTENTTNDQCEKMNCCVATDEYLRKRNLTWGCLQSFNSSGRSKNGTCITYTGHICSTYFNDSVIVNSNNETEKTVNRFVDSAIGMNKTDKTLKKFFNALKRNLKKPKCLDIIAPAMCKYGLPACYADGTPMGLCREDCEHIMNNCREDMIKLLGAIQYIAIEDGIDFYHMAVLDSCRSFRYSYQYDKNENKSCLHIFDNLDRTGSKPPNEKKSIVLYVAVVAAVVILLVVLVILIVIHRLKKKRKAIEKLESEMLTVTSVRDRIRRDSYVNPLLELLANSKPGELVQYPLDCVEYIRDLGEGQFGKVFQGRVHGIVKGEESSDVAVKCLKEGSASQAIETFHQEVALMSCLQHPNVLRLLAVSTEEEPYCMIFEFMENGDLNEYLRKAKVKDVLGDSELIKICKHVAAGMEYLASKKFLHRDLATRNCLVGSNLMVKIADFGMSRNVYHSEYYRVGGEAMLPIRWMPPEAVLYGKFTVAADVYSFGIVVWEIFTFALQPFYGYSNEEVIEFIKKGVLLPQPEDCPDWIYNIMLDCWKREPEERISFTQALNMLKGQFADYDSPPNRTSQFSGTYQVVTAPKPAEYDQVPSHDHQGTNEIENPNYQNLKSTQREADTEAQYQNIKPGVENEAEESDTNVNRAFEEEQDDPRRSLVNDPEEGGARTSSFNKLKSCLENTKKGTEPTSKKSLMDGRKSIKDVLRNHDRYVCTEDLKSQQGTSSNPEASAPTKDFHGYDTLNADKSK